MDDSMNMSMPVMPAYGAGNGQGGFGFGGDWAWILLLLVLFGNNGWGNGNGNCGGMNGLYPWMNNSQNINDGFRDQMLNSQIAGIQNGITSGFGDVQNSLCGGFADVNAAVTAAQNGITQQMFANQMAALQQSNALQAQLAQCCCDNRAATADLKYTIANEACADRAAVTSALQAVTTQNAANTQRILDQMCQDKIDAKNEQIANLQSQLQMAQLAASQNAQTAQILENNEAQTAALERYLAPNPIPAYIVQNPGCCNQNFGCGCGCNS